jgi:HSP20 family protein
MTMLTRWEPFREMRRMHDMLDRIMDDAYMGQRKDNEVLEGLAPVDVYETDDDVVVKAMMPGMTADDIQISVDRDVLTIRGETKHEEKTEEGNGRVYHHRELRYQRFSRSVRLPTLVNADKADAQFENGILTLSLPKAEEVKPKQITVKAK